MNNILQEWRAQCKVKEIIFICDSQKNIDQMLDYRMDHRLKSTAVAEDFKLTVI